MSDPAADEDAYDEWAFLEDNARAWEIPWSGPPEVERRQFEVAPDQTVSYVAWGSGNPEVVWLHGGGQNAHTWDTVILALGRPGVAIDLPGHGRSDRRDDRNYGPWANAAALEAMLPDVAPNPAAVVGMSLGGATAMRLGAIRPDLVTRLVIVDVTPQINDPSRQYTAAERESVTLISGPPTYASFEEMADAAVALSPRREPAAVRRGVRHNAYRRPDGRWAWRYDLFGERPASTGNWGDFTPLWFDVERITVPTLFVRGGESPLVHDADVEEMRRRLPGLEVATVAGSGHAVQSDKPLDLVALVEEFAFTPAG